MIIQCHDAVHMVVGTTENGGSRRGAYRVCDIAVVEFHALGCEAVNVGSPVDAGPIATDGF
jgi:hypothetical protein